MRSLTDMWKAAGSSEQKKPFRWTELPSTRDFMDAVTATLKDGLSVFEKKRGKHGGGTWAHWQSPSPTRNT
jgi:hypothetical protein